MEAVIESEWEAVIDVEEVAKYIAVNVPRSEISQHKLLDVVPMRKSLQGRPPTAKGEEMNRRPMYECDMCDFRIEKAATLRNHKHLFHNEVHHTAQDGPINKKIKLDIGAAIIEDLLEKICDNNNDDDKTNEKSCDNTVSYTHLTLPTKA